MSPQAEKIIADLEAHMKKAFVSLVELVQEEAVNEMIGKLTPTKAKVRLTKSHVQVQLDPEWFQQHVAPVQEDSSDLLQDEEERLHVAPAKHYANPEDDPEYGMVGSGCYTERKVIHE